MNKINFRIVSISISYSIFSWVFLFFLFSSSCEKVSDIPSLFVIPPATSRPHIISSYPSPQANVVGLKPEIFVEFDREMDQVESNSALIISGQSSPVGKVRWAGNRAYFDLENDLILGNAYVLKVNAQAKSKDGYNMEVEYIVHFISGSRIDAPEVTTINPSPGAQGVADTSQISLYFSRPMDQSSVETAFKISPSISGSFNWSVDSRSVTFVPFGLLTNATTYSVTLSVGAKDQEGISIVTTYNSNFQVGIDFIRPSVIELREIGNPIPLVTGVTGIYKDSSLEIVFSESMEFVSTQNAFQITRLDNSSNVSGVFQWNAAFDRLVFNPTNAFEPTKIYRLKMTTSAKDSAGNALDADLIIEFTINNTNGASNSNFLSVTSIQKTSPAPIPQNFFLDELNLTTLNVTGSDLLPGGSARIEISFSHSLDPSTVATNISISKVIGLNAPTSPGIKAIQLQTAGIIPNGKLVIDVESLGVNNYKLRIFGGQSGIRSSVIASETGTWLSQDNSYYFEVIP